MAQLSTSTSSSSITTSTTQTFSLEKYSKQSSSAASPAQWTHYSTQLVLSLTTVQSPSSSTSITLTITFTSIPLESLSLTSFSSSRIIAKCPLDQLPLKAVYKVETRNLGVRYLNLKEDGEGEGGFERFQVRFKEETDLEECLEALTKAGCPCKPAAASPLPLPPPPPQPEQKERPIKPLPAPLPLAKLFPSLVSPPQTTPPKKKDGIDEMTEEELRAVLVGLLEDEGFEKRVVGRLRGMLGMDRDRMDVC